MYGQPGITGDPLYFVIERRLLPKFLTMSSRRRLDETGQEKNSLEFYNVLGYCPRTGVQFSIMR